MDCFCLRKKNAYDFSSPYTMASSGTYRTSVLEEEASSKNGHVQGTEKSNGNHHDSVISENNHIPEDKTHIKQQNTKSDHQNDLEHDLAEDSNSHSDEESEKDFPDVNRNHESQQNPEIVVDEVTEVNQVNMTLDEEQGHKRTSQVSVSSENGPEINGVGEVSERYSMSAEAKDDEIQSHGQGHSGGHTSDHDVSSTSKEHVSFEEQQNMRNSSFHEDQFEETRHGEADSNKDANHAPSYDVTAATKDVPHDVVHMY